MAHKIIACTKLVTVPLTSSLTGFDQTSKWSLIWVTQAKQLNPKKQEIKHKTGGSGCGSVGRAILPIPEAPGSNQSSAKFVLNICLLVYYQLY